MEEITTIRKAIYGFCYKLACRILGPKNIRLSLKLLMEPLNYWRNIEVPVAINNLKIQSSDIVLDVGSPKIASLFIWMHYRCKVYSTDLHDYFWKEYETYLQALQNKNSSGTFVIQKQDARKLDYPHEFFNKVYSISVLEHISDDGDTQAMQEISRVLKKGGLCCVTVPYSQLYKESYTTKQSYYINVRDNRPTFYQRHYDEKALLDRLIAPSKLQLLRVEYFGEQLFEYEKFYDQLPYWLRIAFAPLSPFATRWFIRQYGECALEKAKTAILNFTKR